MFPRSLFVAALVFLATALPQSHAEALNQAQAAKADELHAVTPERLLGMPASEQPAWQAYLSRSRELESRLLSERRERPPLATAEAAQPGKKGAAVSKGLLLSETSEWYSSPAVRTIADRVSAAQNAVGGWSKGNDYNQEPASGPSKRTVWDNGTFDNQAVIHELVFLARVLSASSESTPRREVWRSAFDRGLDYVFSAQYPHGGFPQIYPLGGGYHDAVTFNDNALVNILRFLTGVAARKGHFGFVSEAQAGEAARRLELGIACVLACQIRDGGGLRTAWNQQHDALTLKPARGRNFEPVAACAAESSEVILFLMDVKTPSAELVRAVNAAVAWLDKVALKDLALPKGSKDHLPVPTPGAPRLWARFYELDSNRPLFGDRDRSLHYSLEEISPERRQGYAWYGTWGNKALERHKKWLSKLPADTH